MKRWVVVILVLLLLAAGLGQWLLNDPGYVLVIRGHWRLESSLGLILLLLIFSWLASLLAVLLVLWLWRLLAPQHLSTRMRGYLDKRRMERGLTALGRGDWARAEKLFAATSSENWRWLGQLGGAFAAQQQGSRERRDTNLQAAETDRDGGLFALWLGLYWRVQDGDANAAAELEEQLAHHPDNLPLRELAAQLAEQQQDWPRLYKHVKKLPANQVKQTRLRHLWQGLLREAATSAGDDPDRIERLHKCWRELPSTLKKEPSLVVQYGGYLAQMGESKGALKLLDEGIKRGWDERYANLLADMPVLQPGEFLQQLDAWQQLHPGIASLTLLAGRTAMKASLWGKAEVHFRHAGEAGSIPAWAELARLKQAQGDSRAVQACLTEQAKLACGKLPLLPLPQKIAGSNF